MRLTPKSKASCSASGVAKTLFGSPRPRTLHRGEQDEESVRPQSHHCGFANSPDRGRGTPRTRAFPFTYSANRPSNRDPAPERNGGAEGARGGHRAPQSRRTSNRRAGSVTHGSVALLGSRPSLPPG